MDQITSETYISKSLYRRNKFCGTFQSFSICQWGISHNRQKTRKPHNPHFPGMEKCLKRLSKSPHSRKMRAKAIRFRRISGKPGNSLTIEKVSMDAVWSKVYFEVTVRRSDQNRVPPRLHSWRSSRTDYRQNKWCENREWCSGELKSNESSFEFGSPDPCEFKWFNSCSLWIRLSWDDNIISPFKDECTNGVLRMKSNMKFVAERVPRRVISPGSCWASLKRRYLDRLLIKMRNIIPVILVSSLSFHVLWIFFL
jgi:hypothetical protein